MKFIDTITDEEKEKYSLNLLLAEFRDIEKAKKRQLKEKLFHNSYKNISTIIFS